MKVYKITNFVVVLLVIAAVYQTGQLWLEGTTGYNFFYALAENFSDPRRQADGNVLLATRYAVGEGDAMFSVYYPDDTGNSTMLNAANRALEEILAPNDSSPEKTTADWKEILEDRCIVMQYDITIVPARRMGEESRAYFVNSDTNECVMFRCGAGAASTSLYQVLERKEGEMLYISTGQRTSASVLWRNLFVPQWAVLPCEYAPLTQEFVFERDGEPSRAALENTVKNFFRNFSVDWSTRDGNGVFTFSDSQTVVKYHPSERLLEYYSYENYGTDKNRMGLLEGYQISCNFLKNDTSLQTDIYLADIQRTINNEIIYYFDYAVDNLPVSLSQSVQDRIGQPHAIQITLRNQAVKEYRRYAVNYRTADEATEQINVQFIDALDEANKTYQAVEEKVITDVKNISLGYHVDLAGSIRLKWFVTLYDYTFVVDTEQEQNNLTAVSATP